MSWFLLFLRKESYLSLEKDDIDMYVIRNNDGSVFRLEYAFCLIHHHE